MLRRISIKYTSYVLFGKFIISALLVANNVWMPCVMKNQYIAQYEI